MSRNNLILVVSVKGRYYVIPDVCADTEWNVRYAYGVLKGRRYMRDRGKALILAHDMQRRQQTEYGVRELRIYEHLP